MVRNACSWPWRASRTRSASAIESIGGLSTDMHCRETSKSYAENWPEALKQLGSAEKERNLHRGRLRRVGPVNAIAFDALREALANGAFGRIRRIGGAHGVSPFLDRVRS